MGPQRTGPYPTLDTVLTRFAERLRDEAGAERVLLFGSHARGTATPESDYDFIVVSDRFGAISQLKRPVALYRLFTQVGGNASIDLICLTPEEFEQARRQITLVSAVLPEAIDLLPVEAEQTVTTHSDDLRSAIARGRG